MLREFAWRVPQSNFEDTTVLRKLNSMSIDTQESRFKMLVEILKYTKALNLELVDWNELVTEYEVKKILAEANSYRRNLKVVSHKLSTLLKLFSYEFIKMNNNKFDLEEFDKYLKDESNYVNLIKTPQVIDYKNILWSFIWKDWRKYEWQWLWPILKLKWADIENILLNIKSDEDYINNAINFLIIPENEPLIKKESTNKRIAWIDIIKHINGANNLEAKIFKLSSK